jgi:hypothetical protein
MATYDVTGPGGVNRPGRYNPGVRTPYLVENTIDVSQINSAAGSAQNDVLQCIDVPAETLVMAAGVEVLTACSSSVVIDIGITGSTAGFSDPDAFVDAYDATSASYAPRDATADADSVMLTCKVADTIDALMAGAASTAGKIRVWAILCDISGVDETDRQSDAQHDTGS